MLNYILAILLTLPILVLSNTSMPEQSKKIEVSLLLNPYKGDRAGKELSDGPEALAKGGLKTLINRLGCHLTSISRVKANLQGEKALWPLAAYGHCQQPSGQASQYNPETKGVPHWPVEQLHLPFRYAGGDTAVRSRLEAP